MHGVVATIDVIQFLVEDSSSSNLATIMHDTHIGRIKESIESVILTPLSVFHSVPFP